MLSLRAGTRRSTPRVGGETPKKGKGNLGTASTAERKLLPKGVRKLEKTSSRKTSIGVNRYLGAAKGKTQKETSVQTPVRPTGNRERGGGLRGGLAEPNP